MGECFKQRFVLLSNDSVVARLEIVDGPGHYNLSFLSDVISNMDVMKMVLAFLVVLLTFKLEP